MKHIFLYDATCPFCRAWMARFAKRDRKKLFYFAPLNGRTAQRFVEGAGGDEAILIEDAEGKKRVWRGGRALLRALSLLGGTWSYLKLFTWLPVGFLYRFIASHRMRLKPPEAPPIDPDRLLP